MDPQNVKFESVEQFWGSFFYSAAAAAAIVVVDDDVFFCLYFYEIKAVTS